MPPPRARSIAPRIESACGLLNRPEVSLAGCRCIIIDVSLYERYELLDLSRDDGVKTFEARELATGRPVKVHLFVHPSAPLQVALLKAIDRLPDAERQRVVERGKHEGTPYVVTDRLMDYPGLSEWVQAASHHGKSSGDTAAKPPLETAGAWKVPASPAPPPPPLAAPPIRDLNQQFAELFPTVERPIVADSLAQPRENPPSVIIAPARSAVTPPPAAQQPPAAAPAPAAKTEPGEFTRMFQAPQAAVPPSPPPPPQPQKEAGEFTRMFQSPVATPAVAAPVPPPAPAAVQTQPIQTQPIQTQPIQTQKEAGEFTRMFQSPAAAAPPAASTSGPSDFARFFETTSPAGPMPNSPAVQQPLAPQAPGNRVSEFTRTFGKADLEMPPPAPAAPPPAKEPGEFTRMFHAPGASAPATSPGPARSAPPPMGGTTQGFAMPVAPAPAAPAQNGPGEYTRQFSAPADLTFGQTSATPSGPLAGSPSPNVFAPPAMGQAAMPNMAPAPLPAKKSNLVLILGIAGIVLVAVLVFVFFAMRPK